MNRLIFLGTGTSNGVPVLGCGCEVCMSSDPRDRRLRTSALLKLGSQNILFDIGPDFREQSLRQNILRIDGVLVTHPHYDHIGGLDDIRQVNFTMNSAIDIYGTSSSLGEIRERCGYMFRETQEGGGKPKVALNEIEPYREFTVGGTKVTPFTVMHGEIPILGYRIGGLVYITDASAIPDKSLELIRSEPVDVLVVNALRYAPHPTHFNLDQALEFIAKVKHRSMTSISPRDFTLTDSGTSSHPRESLTRAYLVHVTHHFGQAKTQAELPKDVYLAYDGLEAEY